MHIYMYIYTLYKISLSRTQNIHIAPSPLSLVQDIYRDAIWNTHTYIHIHVYIFQPRTEHIYTYIHVHILHEKIYSIQDLDRLKSLFYIEFTKERYEGTDY